MRPWLGRETRTARPSKRLNISRPQWPCQSPVHGLRSSWTGFTVSLIYVSILILDRLEPLTSRPESHQYHSRRICYAVTAWSTLSQIHSLWVAILRPPRESTYYVNPLPSSNSFCLTASKLSPWRSTAWIAPKHTSKALSEAACWD